MTRIFISLPNGAFFDFSPEKQNRWGNQIGLRGRVWTLVAAAALAVEVERVSLIEAGTSWSFPNWAQGKLLWYTKRNFEIYVSFQKAYEELFGLSPAWNLGLPSTSLVYCKAFLAWSFGSSIPSLDSFHLYVSALETTAAVLATFIWIWWRIRKTCLLTMMSPVRLSVHPSVSLTDCMSVDLCFPICEIKEIVRRTWW